MWGDLCCRIIFSYLILYYIIVQDDTPTTDSTNSKRRSRAEERETICTNTDGNRQKMEPNPIFQFQNIETDSRGEPKVQPTTTEASAENQGANCENREPSNRLNKPADKSSSRGGSSSDMMLDDDVFEASGDALTAVMETLLKATELTNTQKTVAQQQQQPFERNVPLRNTFPKYYKPNIIIQTKKKDPNENNSVLVAKTNQYDPNDNEGHVPSTTKPEEVNTAVEPSSSLNNNALKTLTSVKMKIGRNANRIRESMKNGGETKIAEKEGSKQDGGFSLNITSSSKDREPGYNEVTKDNNSETISSKTLSTSSNEETTEKVYRAGSL